MSWRFSGLEESAEAVWESDKDAPELSQALDGAEVVGQTQDTVEGLHLSAGPGTSWNPPGGASGSCWGNKDPGCTAGPVPTMTHKDKWLQNGWMDSVNCSTNLDSVDAMF